MANPEAFSRVIIDKALTESGWTLTDPHQVRFELHGPSGRADYVLLGKYGPLCVVEAKKEDADPYDAKEQARGYAENLKAPFVIKFVRNLCEQNGIAVDRDKALHSLFGEYVKKTKTQGRIESEMTERILKSTVSVLDAFNHVRNNQSLAHDNPILNYEESLLIFNHVASSIRFLRDLESRTTGCSRGEQVIPPGQDEIPF